jgi:hypothetical protein
VRRDGIRTTAPHYHGIQSSIAARPHPTPPHYATHHTPHHHTPHTTTPHTTHRTPPHHTTTHFTSSGKAKEAISRGMRQFAEFVDSAADDLLDNGPAASGPAASGPAASSKPILIPVHDPTRSARRRARRRDLNLGDRYARAVRASCGRDGRHLPAHPSDLIHFRSDSLPGSIPDYWSDPAHLDGIPLSTISGGARSDFIRMFDLVSAFEHLWNIFGTSCGACILCMQRATLSQ